jgi:hypothetical protein
MVFRPLSNRSSFKEQESLTVWVSDDENRLPIRNKAELAGSIKADLDAFKDKNRLKLKIMNISENGEAIFK